MQPCIMPKGPLTAALRFHAPSLSIYTVWLLQSARFSSTITRRESQTFSACVTSNNWRQFSSALAEGSPQPLNLNLNDEGLLSTLILLRHGESEWNYQNRYTGWCDVGLTEKGEAEARTAGRLLYENGIEVDQAYTSVLKRAEQSCSMALKSAKQPWVPVTQSWRLNERHYGALQGYNKDSAYRELNIDQELVMTMRRSYDVRPPRMNDDHPHWHGNDCRYRHLTPEELESSRAESLKDTAARIMPFYDSVIAPALKLGRKCLVVSHANTIRTLVKQLDSIGDEDIKGLSIPTGIPLLYRLDENMKPVDPVGELAFQYKMEPKGYVSHGNDMFQLYSLFSRSTSSHSDTYGEPHISMGFAESIWETLNA